MEVTKSNGFYEMTEDEMVEIDAGGWLSVIGGGLIAAGAIVAGGGAVVVGVGVASGILTAVSGW